YASWSDAITRVQSSGARARQQIADILAAQQRSRRAPERALSAARQLADPRAVAIVTGQQAGLFGGPLYTLLKALPATQLTDQVARDFKVPAVPVFWIESEDHDWDEVRSCTVFDGELAPRTIALPAREGRREDAPPVASITLDESVSAALDELDRVLPATE